MRLIIGLLALLVPSLGWAQSYPSPTFKNLTVNGLASFTNVPIFTGCTGYLYGNGSSQGTCTTSTGSGSVVLASSPTLTTPNLGTPSSVTLTNGTGLPIGTGVSGLGTGVASALGNATNAAAGFVTYSGALGTPTLVAPSITGSLQNSGFSALTGSATYTIPSSGSYGPNGYWASGSSQGIVWCPSLNFGCASGQWTAQAVYNMLPQGDASNQESGLLLFMRASTGQDYPWSTSAAFSSGQYVEANGNLYIETASSCTTASSGSGPSGTGTGISDGTCVWNYKAPSYVEGKNALNVNTVGYSGAGKLWDFAGGTQLESGWNGHFAASIEMDTMNYSGTDAAPYGSTSIYGIYLGGVSHDPITASMYIAPQTQSGGTHASHDGIWINGGSTGIKDNDIYIIGSATAAYYSAGNFSGEVFGDASTSPTGINLAGTYSNAAIQANGTIKIIGPSSGNLYIANSGEAQAWYLTAQSGANGNFTIYDSIYGKTPIVVYANAMNSALTITGTGIQVATGGSYSVGSAAGVSCTGAPSASYAVTGGIVTHC